MAKSLFHKTWELTVIAGFIALFHCPAADAKDIYVPAEYPTIQSAIDANTTENGDRIFVAAGQYDIDASITYNGKNIIVKSIEGAEATIIQANNIDDVIHITSGESRDAVLQGFTIKGAKEYGILCGVGNPIIKENIITENGAGIFIFGSSNALITKNQIFGNSNQDYHGGGIACDLGSPHILENIIHSNTAGAGGGIACYDGSTAIIERNLIYNNTAFGDGGGVYSCDLGNSIVLLGNTIVGNNGNGGGLYIRGDCKIRNCIVWFNPTYQDDNIIETDWSNIFYNNISGFCHPWDGQGNISLDPLFADPDNGDYHLKSQAGRWDPIVNAWVVDAVTSPCIDAGDPAGLIGLEPFPNGGVVNMGAYGGTAEASKSFFGKPVCEGITAGDINGDCKVDLGDFAIMARHWLESN
jgi:parallel beta-helix repeat protein